MTPTYRYESIAAYQANVEDMRKATPDNAAWLKEYFNRLRTKSRYGSGYDYDWLGSFGNDYEAAATALREGWPEGRNLVATLVEQLRTQITPPTSIRRRIRKADQGDSLEIQDVYAGRIDTAWRVAKRDWRAIGPQEIWIASYMGLSFRTSGEVLKWRGAAVAVLTEILTEAGYNVGIVAYTRQEHAFRDGPDQKKLQIEVCIKDPRDPINPDALAGAIVNPAFYRLFYWQWCASREHDLLVGLGHPKPYEMPSNYLTGNQDVSNEATAVAYLKNALAKLGQT